MYNMDKQLFENISSDIPLGIQVPNQDSTVANILLQTLKKIEETTGKMYTLTLHRFGTTSRDLIVKSDETNKRWKVKMYEISEDTKTGTIFFPIGLPPSQLNEEYNKLNGEYENLGDIFQAIGKLRFSYAIKEATINAFSRKGRGFEWECACGHQDSCTTWEANSVCQGPTREWMKKHVGIPFSERPKMPPPHYIFPKVDRGQTYRFMMG